MTFDQSTNPLRVAPTFSPGSHAPPPSGGLRLGVTPAPPPIGRSLAEEADGLIRDLFGCGFTIAGVQSHHHLDTELSDLLTTLITDLDDAIRRIRRALCAVEAA